MRASTARVSVAVSGVCLGLAGCGGGGGEPAPIPVPLPTPTPNPGPDLAARSRAASSTAQGSSNACAPIRPFHWEIGDAAQRQAGASVNLVGSATSDTIDSTMLIASASKLLYGACVAERRAGQLSAEDIQFLSFQSGYTNVDVGGCDQDDSVGSCVARGSNGVQTAVTINRLYYNGGHMQKHASLPGRDLGPMSNAALANEITLS